MASDGILSMMDAQEIDMKKSVPLDPLSLAALSLEAIMAHESYKFELDGIRYKFLPESTLNRRPLMGTKNNPGKFDAYGKAEPDEPMFTLLARDPQAPLLIRQWARDRRLRDPADPKVAEAFACADAMEAWRKSERPLETDIPPDGVHVDPASFRTDFTSKPKKR